jgi:hypothetical protein
MKSFGVLVALVVCALSAMTTTTNAFAPIAVMPSAVSRRNPSKIFINIGEPERDKLTRESEPQDYFKT